MDDIFAACAAAAAAANTAPRIGRQSANRTHRHLQPDSFASISAFAIAAALPISNSFRLFVVISQLVFQAPGHVCGFLVLCCPLNGGQFILMLLLQSLALGFGIGIAQSECFLIRSEVCQLLP